MVRTLLKRGAVTGVAVLGIEAAYAVLRPSPELESFDPSGEFGDPSHPALRVVVLGDSSVTAPGVSGPEEIWVSIVCRRLARVRHVVLTSYAVGGARAEDVIDGQLDNAIAAGADLILLSVGANDVIKGVPRRMFLDNLDHLVGELARTGATVVQSGVGIMGTIPRLYPPLSNMMSRRARQFDRAHHQIAEKHGTSVVDQWSDDPSAWASRSMWADDLFHVSAEGHARWAETAWKTIEPLCNGSGGPG